MNNLVEFIILADKWLDFVMQLVDNKLVPTLILLTIYRKVLIFVTEVIELIGHEPTLVFYLKVLHLNFIIPATDLWL